MAFDQNKYKAIFEKRFGSGSFESGLSNAREIGRTKAQADFAKKDYSIRMSEARKRAKKEAERNSPENYWAKEVVDSFNKEQQNKEFQKQSDSSLRNPDAKKGQGSAGESYWASKGVPVGHGNSKPYQSSAPKNNSYKNPYSRSDLKEALSILRKNEDEEALDSFARKFNSLSSAGKDVGDALSAYDKTKKYTDKYWEKDGYVAKGASRDINGNIKSDGYDETIEERKWDFQMDPVVNKKHEAWLAAQKKDEPKKPKKPGFLSDLGAAGKAAFQAFNPFDDMSMKEATENFMNRKPSDQFNEVARGANRAVDSASLGAMSNLDKKLNNRDPYYTEMRKFGEGGGTDILTSGLGYLVPGVGAYKALNATKAGKALTGLGSQGIKQRLAAEAAKGSITGAGLSGAEVGIREGLNPDDYNWKQNTGLIGLGVAGGAIADPLLYGVGKGIGKGLENATSKAMKDIMPSDEDAAKTIANMIRQSREELLALPEPKPEPLGLPQPQPKLPKPTPLVPDLKRPNGLNNPIPQIPDVMRQPLAQARLESKGLGFGIGSKYEPKASNRMMLPESTQNQGYWQKRYEDFAKHVNSSYDMNRMTPEALEDIWTQFARYDEPVKLDQVIDLAYPKGFEAASKPKQDISEPFPIQEPPAPTIKDDLKEDPRINELVKGLFPPQRPISRVATNDEIIKMMEETVANQPRKAEDILKPLQFKRTIPSKPLVDEIAATAEAGVKQDFESITPGKMVEDDLPLLRADDPIQDVDFDPTTMKDISGFKAATTDVYRIFRDAFGKDFERAGKPVLDKLDGAKKQFVGMQTDLAGRLKTEVVDKLNIKKGSKESALVQQYGEKKISLDQLKQQSPDKWRDIVKADQWFRQTYDQLIDTINAARAQAYPSNPDKQVPKLDNYYRHFRELNGLEGLKNIFDSPSQIDPHLAGLSQHTNPNSKFHGFMQKRGLGPYKNDAVGGFLEYIPNAAYATHIDQVIPVFKNLRRQLADGTADSKNINNFIEFLYNYSNDLAGKTNPYFDRNLQQLVGRKTMAVLNWVNNRVKKNVILGNVGSTLAQLANIPNGIAYAKPNNAAKGLTRTLTSIFDKNAPMHKSPFLQERYIGKLYREFDQRLIDQPEKMAGWLIETADRVGTSFVWNSVYEKALKQGIENPVAHADDMTRKLIAGRGIGEVPLMQKSKAVQLVMPFTLEVANLWRVMGDFGKTKDFGALATLFVGNFILNKAMEETRGSAVTFDPIDAIWDAFTDEELTGFQKVGRVGGEVLTNVPLGQHIAGLYPENGQVFNIKGPTRKELFGERDPQRFGTGLVAANGLSDFAFKFALPFGGNQLKKTLSGVETLQEEGSYIKDAPVQLPFVGENQKLRYPVEPDAWNSTKALLFGPSATNEAQEYYDNKRRPLSENQTKAYEQGGQEYYNNLMADRQIKTIQSKIKEVEKDKSLSLKERQEKLLVLYKQLQSTQ